MGGRNVLRVPRQETHPARMGPRRQLLECARPLDRKRPAGGCGRAARMDQRTGCADLYAVPAQDGRGPGVLAKRRRTMEVTDRVALVTGGSRDIGGTIARALARAGADVAISYIGNQEEARSTLNDVKAAGRRGAAVQLDQR